MLEGALSKLGAQVVMVSSADENFPPENMIDGRTDTFWVSTGLFPQEAIISLRSEMSINSVQVHCYNVKKLSIYQSSKGEPRDFEKVAEKEFEQTEGSLQVEEFPMSRVTANYLKLVIDSGYNHFISVHKVHVDGTSGRD